MHKALVIFSGGQDSATVLGWALDRYDHVETVGFDYGQRHDVELEARQLIRDKIGSIKSVWEDRLGTDHLIAMPSLGKVSQTAMTENVAIDKNDAGLPNTFVPGRNLAFLVFAGALAWRRNQKTLIAGMCETDFSGYPDCRAATLTAQMHAINLGMETTLGLETPLMALTKAQSWALAFDIGGQAFVDLIRVHSHSCYLGVRDTLHNWGYGCGKCPACELRANGWARWSQDHG